MDRLQQIITIISTVMGVIVTATGFLIPLVKNQKTKRALAAINKIVATIQPLVIDAEKFSQYSGEEKKQYVLTRVNDFCIKNNIVFDEAQVSALIEQIVATTKLVNARPKDTPPPAVAGTE